MIRILKIRIFLKILFIICFSAATIWLFGFIWFVAQVPGKAEIVKHETDAIVVLTGGTARLNAGLYLLENGYAEKLFISGVGKGVTIKNIINNSGLSDAEKNEALEHCGHIVLGYEAANTQGNANEVSNWIKSKKYHSIYLVTANYHIPRAMLEFNHLMPDEKFYPYPVFPDNFTLEKWFSHYPTFKLLRSEYHKYFAALTRIYF